MFLPMAMFLTYFCACALPSIWFSLMFNQPSLMSQSCLPSSREVFFSRFAAVHCSPDDEATLSSDVHEASVKILRLKQKDMFTVGYLLLFVHMFTNSCSPFCVFQLLVDFS